MTKSNIAQTIEAISITLPKSLPEHIKADLELFAKSAEDSDAAMTQLAASYAGVAGCELCATNSGIELASSIRSVKNKRIGIRITACLGEGDQEIANSVANYELIELGRGRVRVAHSMLDNVPYPNYTDILVDERCDASLRSDVEEACKSPLCKDFGRGRYVYSAPLAEVVKRLRAFGVECVIAEPGILPF